MAIGFPPFIRNSADAVVRQLAKARSFAQSNPRAVQGVIGGLTAPIDPYTVGNEGFFSGLLRGLGGATEATQRYDFMTHQQERQRAQDAAAAERLRIEQERLGLEQRRVAVLERPRAGEAEEDYTVPVTDAEGDIQRAEPFYLQGVPRALKKTAGAQFFQQRFAPPPRPDPFESFLRREEYKEERERLAPEKIPTRIPKDVSEQDILESLDELGTRDLKEKPEEYERGLKTLTAYMQGFGSADSPAIRRRAQAILRSIQAQGR